jgi:hypothetical protein
MTEEENDTVCFREQLPEIIERATGIRIRMGTLNQLCAPARNEGPEVEGWLGHRPLYSARKAIEWAKNRIRPAPYRVHPPARGNGEHHANDE